MLYVLCGETLTITNSKLKANETRIYDNPAAALNGVRRRKPTGANDQRNRPGQHQEPSSGNHHDTP